MIIRKFELNDLDRVFELLNELYEGKLKYDVFSKIYQDRLNNDTSYYVVSVIDNKVVGVLTSELEVKLTRERKQMYIDTIIVDKDYRNKGIGKALMENAINFAINNNCEIVELTSKLNNENAHRFYEGIGFKKHSYKFKKYL